MGYLDDKYLAGKGTGIGSMFSGQQYRSNSKRRSDAMALIDAGVGSVTSRDQIINPYDLIDPTMYSQNRRGKAQYESDLQALINFQSQQQAAYQEWYDSPEQAAIREREAGLNPDLIGLDNAGSSAEAPITGSVPGQSLPTNGQTALDIASTLSSIVSNGVSLASLPLQFASLSNVKLSNEGLRLDNEAKEILNTTALSTSVASDIEGLLSTAVQAHNDSGSSDPFDYDGWFANESNFASIRSLYEGNPRFDNVLSSQRSQILKHRKNVAALQNDWASDQFEFGQIASDPMFNSDQKIMLATNIPLQAYFFEVRKAALERQRVYDEVDAEIKRGTDVQLAIDAANEENEYLASLDGRKRAADETFKRKCERAALKRKNQIDKNLFDLWNKNPATLEAQGAMYLLGGMQSKQWYDFMGAYAAAYQLSSIVDNIDTSFDPVDSSSYNSNPFTDPHYNGGQRWIDLGGVSFGD